MSSDKNDEASDEQPPEEGDQDSKTEETDGTDESAKDDEVANLGALLDAAVKELEQSGGQIEEDDDDDEEDDEELIPTVRPDDEPGPPLDIRALRREIDGPATGRGDPRVKQVEPLLASGEWEKICELLGPAEEAAKLPPVLGLLYAFAQREAAGDESTTDANFLAIHSIAALMGVADDSRLALVLGKALMRRNPATWSKREAPPARLRVFLIVIAVLFGTVVGWLVGPGAVPFKELLKSVFH